MRTSTFIAVAFAALAQAQTRADIPSCALPCLDSSVTANTKCSTTDYACICKDFNAVQAAATGCVISKCGADVAINKVLPATQALCAANLAGSGSSAAVSSSSAATSPAQETTSAAATTAPQTSAAVSSAPSSVASSAPVSSAPSTVTVGTASTTVVATTPVGSGVVPPTGNRTTTGPTSAPTGAASALLPGLAMLALGVLAL